MLLLLFFGKNNMVNMVHLFSEQQNREIKLPPPYVTNLEPCRVVSREVCPTANKWWSSAAYQT